jgi:5-methylthioadenosine/S-adenosylhomocysteine deaminase
MQPTPTTILPRAWRVRDQLLDEPLLSFCLAPHAPYTVSERSFARVLTLAEQIELPIHLHLHETAQEIDDSLQRFAVRPIERLRRLGLLSPALIAVHAVHLSAAEIEMLAQHGCSVAHCPQFQSQAGQRHSPHHAVVGERSQYRPGHRRGGPANNRLDLFQEMRLAALLAKEEAGRADAINAHRVLHMATLGGARALGLEASIGSLTPGQGGRPLCRQTQ